MRENTLWRSSLIMTASLWIASLLLPAITFVFDVEPNLFSGWEILTSGWLTVLAFQTGWLANLTFWVLVLALLPLAPALRLVRWSAVALLIFSAHTIDLFLRPEFYDVQSIHAGYYLWLTANVGLAAYALLFVARKGAVTAE